MNAKQKSILTSALYLGASFCFIVFACTLETVWLILAIIFLLCAIVLQRVWKVRSLGNQRILEEMEKVASQKDKEDDQKDRH